MDILYINAAISAFVFSYAESMFFHVIKKLADKTLVQIVLGIHTLISSVVVLMPLDSIITLYVHV